MPKKGSPNSTNIEVIHRHWLADLFNMETDGFEGIDIFDNSTDQKLEEKLFAIELKCKLLQKGYSEQISAKTSQYLNFPNEHPNKELFWAFLYYKLSDTIRNIIKQTKKKQNFSTFITERHVYFKPWSFMAQFPPNQGKLESWRYVPRNLVIEGEYEERIVIGGKLYFPNDCSLINRLKHSENFSKKTDIPF